MKQRTITKLTIILVIIALLFTSVLIIDSTLSEQKKGEPPYVSLYFNPEKVNTVNIIISDNNWQDMCKNALQKEYYSCDIEINGDLYKNVGIRTKGTGSLEKVAGMPDSDRYSFKIKSEKYIPGQTFKGLTKFVLNDNVYDPTYMKEYLSYQLMTEAGVPTPLFAYAAIYINGKYWGLYLMIEAIDETFAERTFGANYGQLYKPRVTDEDEVEEIFSLKRIKLNSEKITNKKTFHGADLIYTDDAISSYRNIFDNAVYKNADTKSSKRRVVEALKNLNYGTKLEECVNVDEVLRYFAANFAVVNVDGYTGIFMHNYYLYEKNGKLSMIPWDYNNSFGTYAPSPSDTVNFPIDTPFEMREITLSERPMFGSLISVEKYKNQYHTYIKNIAENFLGDSFAKRVDKISALIDKYIKTDPTAFYSYEEHIASLPELKKFAILRAKSILGQINGSIATTYADQREGGITPIPIDSLDFEKLNIMYA